MKKLPKNTEYTPKEIAEASFLEDSYRELMRAVKKNIPCKNVQNVREDLQKMFCRFTMEELISFDRQVIEEKKDVERRVEIQKLRNQISNKKIKLQQLINEG